MIGAQPAEVCVGDDQRDKSARGSPLGYVMGSAPDTYDAGGGWVPQAPRANARDNRHVEAGRYR